MILAAGLFVVGLLLLLAGLLLSLIAGVAAMPSYLADWVFWSALPVGALPVVMVLDLAGPRGGFGIEAALRRLLLLMPIAALLLIPMLVRPAAVFGWAGGHGFSTPFGQAWMTHGGFIVRSIIYFIIWSLLALPFLAPPVPGNLRARRNLAAVGLFVFMITATLAAADWAMAVAPAWSSAEFGLLLIAAQATIAISVAVLTAGAGWRLANPEVAASLLLIGVVTWAFMQFIQYLVIWSGDKPGEITWYMQRDNLGGAIVVWFGLIGGLLIPFSVLHVPRLRRHPRTLPAMALLILCIQALGMLWLITPSLRHYFAVSGMDILELAGIGGVMLGLFLGPPLRRRHAEIAHG